MGSSIFPGVPGRMSFQRSQLEPGYDPSPQTLAMVDLVGQVANISAATIYTVPSSAITNLYEIKAYIVCTNTPTAATLPAVSVIYTDLDTNASQTVVVVASQGSIGAAGSPKGGGIVHNAKPGTAIQYTP